MTRVNREEAPKPKLVIDADNLKLLTVKQVAEIFQVTEYTVRTWLKEPDGLRGTKMGRGTTGHWRVAQAELIRFANQKFGSDVPNG